MKVIVCQHGSRHRYAIARILEKNCRLAALYTDSSAASLLGRLAAMISPAMKNNSLTRLCHRKTEGVPIPKIYSSDVVVFRELAAKICGRTVSEEEHWGQWLSVPMIRWGVPPGSIIYNMYCENLDFIRHARTIAGVKIITDMYIYPLQSSYLAGFDEKNKLPLTGIDSIPPEVLHEVCHLSDFILCPSAFVAQGVRLLAPDCIDKIRICPYGSSIQRDPLMAQKVQRGRFFWAGRNWFRKGLFLLADAANDLKERYPDMEFRAAGLTIDDVPDPLRYRNINFLGNLNKQQMHEEFQAADAFVFPTLCEGMAGVVIEAIASGCPVITSRQAGVDGIRPGETGFLMEAGDCQGLIQTMEKLYLDRSLRQRVAANSVAAVDFYSEEAWGQRLNVILSEIDNLERGQ